MSNAEIILSVTDLKVHFHIKDRQAWPWTPARTLKAVDGVSLTLRAGETLGVVGESGCGKSTLARGILNLIPRTAGEVVWMGKTMNPSDQAAWQAARKDMQMIFQDPLASLDPRMTIGQIIAEPLRIHHPSLSKEEVMAKVRQVMKEVGLTEQQINRYPHEFSGGQCQRIGIARALILEPKLIICDEPVSALDVSIQAQIVNLLKDLQRRKGLALIFIAHDLAVVKHISDRILVMYLGRAMELAEKADLYASPQHPYTKALLSAIPIPEPKLEREKVIQLLQGDLPSPMNPPSGCVFRTRCPIAESKCATTTPQLHQPQSNQQTEAACLLV
ncbi:murein tripeptide/oligopeptide ABC transporter ATP binding protein OppF [Leeia sp. TBRC 13508]|uniref:Murein tripeptide/oligopeptide ABC transporter ATP binding protein OppF n=1 Tax=Leeia speluncae TaxID=2884804 RepID=A0ABS8D3D5_9NEIS|nr:murein tripeptide/oligopeptide ABC transporter ATP binding protein OppF [Leeia speluncae]MCB6182679.1 murein tripeptide/oligopeptide ABC transporter ATP binding protein OppF [Leeia speluncae]